MLPAPPAPFQASFFTSSRTGAGFLLEPACILLGSFTLASRVLAQAPRATPFPFHFIGEISAPKPFTFLVALHCSALL